MTLKKGTKYLLLILPILALYAYPLFYEPFHIDEEVIIEPLRHVHSISDYIRAWKSGSILDIQPVRDISHIIDLKIEKLTGIEIIGEITNIFILLLTCLAIYRVFIHFFSAKISMSLCFLFAVHPATFHIYVEETSRKHILSFFFMLLTFVLFLNKERLFKTKRGYILATSMTHLLSLFSQPINLLYPCWMFFFAKDKLNIVNFKNFIKNHLHLFILSIGAGILNLYYFTVIFKEITGFAKSSFHYEFGLKLLILGRFISQLFIPINFSLFYEKASLLVFLGLILAIILLYLSLKLFRIRRSVLIWTPFFFTFITLYNQGSNIFFLNTYVLTPSLTLILLLGTALNKYKTMIRLILPAILIASFSASLYYATLRKDSLSYLIHNYQSEASCGNLNGIVLLSLRKNRIEIFKKYANEMIQRHCIVTNKRNRHFPIIIMAILLLDDSSIPLKEKISLLEERIGLTEDLTILKAYLFLKNDMKSEFDYELNKLSDTSNPGAFYDLYPSITIEKYCNNRAGEKQDGCTHFLKYKDTHKNFKGRYIHIRGHKIMPSDMKDLNVN